MNFSRTLCRWAGVCLLPVMLAGCATSHDRDSGAVRLLKGRDMSPFHTYLRDFGTDNDPDRVFTMDNGVLRISGQHYGYLVTKETFADYRLVAEFKWGSQTWAPRENKARDSGVLVHVAGRDQIWPKSIEAQIIEGGTGDILVVSGALLTVNGVTLGPQTARFDRPGRNPWQDVKGFRGPNEIENPHGEWNRLEVLAVGDRIRVSVNGRMTLEGTNAVPQAGKILLQSEGAEIFFRRVDVYPVKGI